MESLDIAMQRILEAIGDRVESRAKGLLRSTTLRNSLFYRADYGARKLEIVIPYYWAEFYLNGHGVIYSDKGRDKGFMVWFADPKDDPRLRGGPPRSRADRKKLTKRQWEIGLEINRERRANGQPPFMYYSREVPASPGSGDLDPLNEEIPRIVREETTRGMKEHVRNMIREQLGD